MQVLKTELNGSRTRVFKSTTVNVRYLLSIRSQVWWTSIARGLTVATFKAETSVDGVLLLREVLAELQFPGVGGSRHRSEIQRTIGVSP